MNEAGEQFAPVPEQEVQSQAQILAASQGAAVAEPPPASTPVQVRRHSDEHAGWLGSVQSLLVTIVIAVFVITFVVQAFQIPSESMENTLLIGDYLLVDKAHYGPGGDWSWLLPYHKIRRGDIIVFRYPVNPNQHFVKRVIGTPGDHIRLARKRVYVNGKLLQEPYAVYRSRGFDSFRDNFPLGDSAAAHLNSSWYRELHTLTQDGELIVPDGYYFVMGDNRDESLDSRYWGFVPRENVVGRPLLIYWSMKRAEPDDPDNELPAPDGKLARFTLAMKQGWHDLRWNRMLTLVR